MWAMGISNSTRRRNTIEHPEQEEGEPRITQNTRIMKSLENQLDSFVEGVHPDPQLQILPCFPWFSILNKDQASTISFTASAARTSANIPSIQRALRSYRFLKGGHCRRITHADHKVIAKPTAIPHIAHRNQVGKHVRPRAELPQHHHPRKHPQVPCSAHAVWIYRFLAAIT